MRSSQYFTRIAFGFCTLLILAGCTQKYQDAGATIKEAFSSEKGVNVSKEKVQNLPYASAFAKINNKGRIFMVLAFSEKNSNTEPPTLKWISADYAMIATKNGRIIKTMGFSKDNLAGLTSHHKSAPPPNSTNTWQATYDWTPGYRYDFNAKVSTRYIGKEVLSTSLWQKETRHIEESIYFPTLQTEFKNQFWLDNDNQIVKTIQHLGPDMDRVEMLFIKPYKDKTTD